MIGFYEGYKQSIIYAIDIVLGFFAGINIANFLSLEILTTNYSEIGKVLEDSIKLAMSILGLIYFSLRIRQYLKEMKFKNSDKELDIMKKQFELDEMFYKAEEEKAREKRKK